MKKRTLTLVLSLVLLLGVLSPVACADAAEETTVQPRYTGIMLISYDFDISSTGKTMPYISVRVDSGYTCEITMRLEKRDAGWETVKEWTASGSGTTVLDKSWYVVSGYDYRAYYYIEVFDEDGNFVESEMLSSGAIYY